MTSEEIFSNVSARLIGALMVHDQMADYYDFLSLRGYKRCHEYHYKKESAMYRKLHRWYINRYNKLIPEQKIDNPDILNIEMWNRYGRQGVKADYKEQAVKTGIGNWVKWEADTMEMLSGYIKALQEIGDMSASHFLEKCLCDVERELKYAQRKEIELASIDYDLIFILQEQQRIHDKYLRKIKCI